MDARRRDELEAALSRWFRDHGMLPVRVTLPEGGFRLVWGDNFVTVNADGDIAYGVENTRLEWSLRQCLLNLLHRMQEDLPAADLPPISVDEVIDAHVLGRLIRDPADLIRAIGAGRALLIGERRSA
ncbi:MAG: hypothetical protein M0Z27_04775 [Thermaerobacter sp.]|jgi:hypothetical protein|nr:hypothetical protein [Thermaerobacter sp.]MDA8145363.1 hypothetical protein [Thermaerobacter sp.]